MPGKKMDLRVREDDGENAPSFLRRQESIPVFVTSDVTGKKMDPRVREDDA